MEAAGNGVEAQRYFGPQHDRFCLGKLICKGGQGSVYHCERVAGFAGPLGSNAGTRYAAKIIQFKGVRARDPEKHFQNLRREIRNMQELHHPRIVNLHNAFWDDNECVIVMDLAPGGDLHSKLKEEMSSYPPPFKGLGGGEFPCKHVAHQLFEGLGYMHSHGVIHRDLKLENILVTESYQGDAPMPDSGVYELHSVKITDFGLSKMRSGNAKCSSLVGTPDYLAPEVLERNYDHRADLWSLGVLLHVILCAVTPFDVQMTDINCIDRFLELVENIKESEPWNNLSDEARDLVHCLLSIEPADRPSPDACMDHPWVACFAAPVSPASSTPLGGRSCRSSPGSPTSSNLAAVAVSGAIRKVIGRAGAALDSVEFHFWAHEFERHGGSGGDKSFEFRLKRDEFIRAVMQEERPQYLGTGIVFYTSHSQILALEGSDAHHRCRFVTSAGSQVVGLQFDGSNLTGIHMAPVTEAGGAVEFIGGRVGYAVDNVTLKLRYGPTRFYGTENGDAVAPFSLAEDEFIVVVEQGRRGAFLGSNIVFYTSAGNVFELSGIRPCQACRFSAPAGRQIAGLGFEGSRLTRVITCPLSGDLADRQAHNAVF